MVSIQFLDPWIEVTDWESKWGGEDFLSLQIEKLFLKNFLISSCSYQFNFILMTVIKNWLIHISRLVYWSDRKLNFYDPSWSDKVISNWEIWYFSHPCEVVNIASSLRLISDDRWGFMGLEITRIMMSYSLIFYELN